jgi:hypothetical protein
MKKKSKLKKVSLLAGAAAAAAVLYPLAIRPWFLRWGATDDDLKVEWPGDELTPGRENAATRAITINASASEVWAWIVQLGQDRGGFYSYTWLENLFGCRMHNANKIIPEFQQRQEGDTVWLTPPERYCGKARLVVGKLIPNRAMILVPPEDAETVKAAGRAPGGSWGFVLEPIDEHSTRLIVCSRSSEHQTLLRKAFERTVFDPAHFIMERRMMLGIKQRAEKSAAQSELRAA